MQRTTACWCLSVVGVIMLAASNLALAVNKCALADGKVVYQDLPCDNATLQKQIKIEPPPPNAHIEAAERAACSSRLSEIRKDVDQLTAIRNAVNSGEVLPNMTRSQLYSSVGQPDEQWRIPRNSFNG